MHEMAICESVLQVLEEQASIQGYRLVKTVWLEIGSLAGIELEALRFSFEVVARGTLGEGAQLELIQTPGEAWCLVCGKTVPISERFHSCPECDGYQLRITGGDQLRIKEVEVQ